MTRPNREDASREPAASPFSQAVGAQGLQQLIEATPSGMAVVNSGGRILLVNDEFERVFGHAREDLIGEPVEMLLPERMRTQHQSEREDFARAPSTRRMGQGRDLWGLRSDGAEIEIEIGLSPFEVQGETLVVASVANISERKQAERRLHRLAYEDALTGLWSRAGLLAQVEEALDAVRSRGAAYHLVVLDLCRLGDINEAYGYGVGDHLLAGLGERLSGECAEDEIVARVGGDKFALLLAERNGGFPGAQGAVDRVNATLRAPFPILGEEVRIEACLAAAPLSAECANAADVMGRAELALRAVREEPGQSRAVYDGAIQQQAQERIATTMGLIEGLEQERFELHFQPKVDLASGQVVSAEALVRWRRADGQLESPARFIPIAERSQLIVPIGEQVLDLAGQCLARWAGQSGMDELHLAVNISAAQFSQSDLVQTVGRMIENTAIRPGQLTLELTETAFEQGTDAMRRQLNGLRALGVELSLDDFGTGYSSLGYLQDFNFDEIKLDRRFVRAACDSAYSREIVAMVTRIAAMIEAQVTAEGIEEATDEETVRRLGCAVGQGFLYSKPVPEREFEALVRSWS